MTTARMAPTLLLGTCGLVEQARRRRLELAPEELRVAVEAPDDHQDDAEQQEADADHQRRPQTDPRVARRRVLRLAEVVGRLAEDAEQHGAAEERQDPGEEEVLRAAAQLAPEVEGAREPGQAVIE